MLGGLTRTCFFQAHTVSRQSGRLIAEACRSAMTSSAGTMSKRAATKRTAVIEVDDDDGDVLDTIESSDSDVEIAGEATVAASKSRAKSGGRSRVAKAAIPGGPYFKPEELTQIRTDLLSWYDANHRVLPWRRTPHSTRTHPAPSGPHEASAPAPPESELPPQQFAYYVWVSEIMLQQTQVATVIPYFLKWISRWPTVADLAGADVEAVNQAWAGLGYYRRARYLLDGARHVMESLGGQFPITAKEMLGIPGVGPYTSAAVASIAFGDTAAVVDGNVVRVLSRLRTLSGDPTKQAALHTAIANELLDSGRPGDFNQAIMELGATVCRPVNPDCGACPASPSCGAYKEWQAYLDGGGSPDIEDAPRVTRFPGKKEVKSKREQAVAVAVLEVVGPAPAGTTPAGGGSAPAAAPARKKQRSMFDFVKSQGSSQQGTGDDGSSGSGLSGAQLLRGGPGVSRSYLLVQRPEGGLLAGLWEFPGVVYEGDHSYAERKALVDSLLAQLLGPGILPSSSSSQAKSNGKDAGAVSQLRARLLRRHDMGTYVHVFSHIKQTNYVERITLAVNDLEAFKAAAAQHKQQHQTAQPACQEAVQNLAGGPAAVEVVPAAGAKQKGKGKKGSTSTTAGEAAAGTAGTAEVAAVPQAVRWVSESEMESEGLSTGPKRIFALACGEPGAAGKPAKAAASGARKKAGPEAGVDTKGSAKNSRKKAPEEVVIE